MRRGFGLNPFEIPNSKGLTSPTTGQMPSLSFLRPIFYHDFLAEESISNLLFLYIFHIHLQLRWSGNIHHFLGYIAPLKLKPDGCLNSNKPGQAGEANSNEEQQNSIRKSITTPQNNFIFSLLQKIKMFGKIE